MSEEHSFLYELMSNLAPHIEMMSFCSHARSISRFSGRFNTDNRARKANLERFGGYPHDGRVVLTG